MANQLNIWVREVLKKSDNFRFSSNILAKNCLTQISFLGPLQRNQL